MKVSPSFQFYWSDFINGTVAMSAEAVGGYIRLLCYQWDHGYVPNDDDAIMAITRCSGNAMASLRHKFSKCDDGLLRNARLEEVRDTQLQYREKQAQKALRSWKSRRKNAAAYAAAHATAMPVDVADECRGNALCTPTSSKEEEVGMESHKKKESKAKAKSAEEAEEYALSIGAQPGQGDAFFWKMEGCGWSNGGKPVKNWKATVLAWHKQGYLPVIVHPVQAPSISHTPTEEPPPRQIATGPVADLFRAALNGEPLFDPDAIEYIDQEVD